jgi:hypothetical protein
MKCKSKKKLRKKSNQIKNNKDLRNVIIFKIFLSRRSNVKSNQLEADTAYL